VAVEHEGFHCSTSVSKFQRNIFESWLTPLYEAYSERKYRFAVKKNRARFRIKFYSDSTSFKLFSRVFVAIIEALTVAEHKFLYILLIDCGRLRC